MVFILPHGVLFRGQSEGKIRKGIIEDNLIGSVIGIADNCFLNTAIPVCLIEFDKNKTDKNILFVDASKECKKVAKINVLTEEHINKIMDAYNNRQDVEKYAHLATFKELQSYIAQEKELNNSLNDSFKELGLNITLGE